MAAADSILAAYGVKEVGVLERAVVQYVCQHGDIRRAAAPIFPEKGSAPPDFALLRTDPARKRSPRESSPEFVRLSQERGNIIVLNFWATWCAPCVDELPELEEIATRYADERVSVYTILYNDNQEHASRWLREKGWDLPVLVDDGNRVATQYRVRGIPHTFIVSPDGKIARAWKGHLPGQLEEFLKDVLRETSAEPGAAGDVRPGIAPE